MGALLDAGELAEAVKTLPGWQVDSAGKSLSKSFVFEDFSACFGVMSRIALAAEKLDHHPDWSNVWNRLDIRLSTHDAGGLTGLDIQLARQINQLAKAAETG